MRWNRSNFKNFFPAAPIDIVVFGRQFYVHDFKIRKFRPHITVIERWGTDFGFFRTPIKKIAFHRATFLFYHLQNVFAITRKAPRLDPFRRDSWQTFKIASSMRFNSWPFESALACKKIWLFLRSTSKNNSSC